MDLLADFDWTALRFFFYQRTHNLTLKDWNKIRDQLNQGYYVILTYSYTHASSYGVKIVHFLKTGKWPTYTHALLNVEKFATNVKSEFFSDFQFVEAVNPGVRRSDWFTALACDGICILKPRHYTQDEVDSTVVDVYEDIGKGYDDFFDNEDGSLMSCVELARKRLRNLPDYEHKMRVFEYMIKSKKVLTPQMFRDCPDFEVVLEICR